MMRFGSFVFPVSHNPGGDGVVIDGTLREIELADAVGLHAVWLTEHHFDGAVAYADPLVMGAAVAARTRQIRIGFAVVELALHHPIRLAAQTALLDNLCHGRLIVGIGRGSAFNHYEYIGFGLSMQDGVDRIEEAEELLVKAWTAKDLRHEGEHWRVAFPMLRPPPYQKPHPPLVRACISEASTIAMARIGRPVMLGIMPPQTLARRFAAYRDAMAGAGFGERAVEAALDMCWASRNVFVAETYGEAREMAEYGFARERKHFGDARRRYNPAEFAPKPSDSDIAPASDSEDIGKAFIMGTPRQVADEIAEMRDAGVRNLMLKFNTGEMDTRRVQASMRLFADRVMPLFR